VDEEEEEIIKEDHEGHEGQEVILEETLKEDQEVEVILETTPEEEVLLNDSNKKNVRTFDKEIVKRVMNAILDILNQMSKIQFLLIPQKVLLLKRNIGKLKSQD